DQESFGKFWRADLHLIGKGIVRFNAVYCPAFLMSGGLPLPQEVVGHEFLLNRGVKESKTLGYVTTPAAVADRHGGDALRYFLMREFSFGQDGTWSHESIVNRANAELAHSFGNLAQRTLSMIFKNLEGVPRSDYPASTADEDLRQKVREATEALTSSFEK